MGIIRSNSSQLAQSHYVYCDNCYCTDILQSASYIVCERSKISLKNINEIYKQRSKSPICLKYPKACCYKYI